jgi:hypothetical protein
VPRQLWHTLGMARPPAMRLTLTPAEFGRLCRMLRDWRKLRHGGVEDDIERELARKIREAGARHAEKLPADPEFTDYIA